MKQKDETIQYVIEVLEKEVSMYSVEFAPERVVKLRKYIESLKSA